MVWMCSSELHVFNSVNQPNEMSRSWVIYPQAQIKPLLQEWICYPKNGHSMRVGSVPSCLLDRSQSSPLQWNNTTKNPLSDSDLSVFDIPAPRTVRNKCPLFITYPACGILCDRSREGAKTLPPGYSKDRKSLFTFVLSVTDVRDSRHFSSNCCPPCTVLPPW